MITPLNSLRKASPTILALHVIKTVFALVLLGRFGLEVARAGQSGDLLHVLTVAARHAPQGAALALWALCAYALLGPLLVQLALAALLQRHDGYLAAGHRYARALVLSLGRFAALACLGAGAFALSTALAMHVAPWLETTMRLAPLALATLATAWLATAHDLAAASLATSSAPRLRAALAAGLRAAVPRAVALQVALGAVALAFFAVGELIARSSTTLLPALLATQACAVAATFTRASWLSAALDHISRYR